jgi:IclR family transcriptional regulator, pca regulon regulatory protein
MSMPIRDANAAKRGGTPVGRDGRLHVESVARALRLLEAFATNAQPQTLSQLARSAGIDKSAAQRLSQTLLTYGYLEQAPTGLKPGRKLLERSLDYVRSNPLIAKAFPILVEMRRDAQERVDLSLFDDLSILYVIRLHSKMDEYPHLLGRRVPAFCTAGGIAVLARLSDARVRDILVRSERRCVTPKTITDVDAILARVAEARRSGYCLSLEQMVIGEVALAVAVEDENGTPVGAVHVAGLLSEWSPAEFARRFAPLAGYAANRIQSL